MNNLIILNENFTPPLKIERKEYYLEVLAGKHNDIDYEAWTSSRETLKGVFGPRNSWPGDVTGLDYNLNDLKNHFIEFENREAFTYSIISRDEFRCIGCLYIRPTPIERFSARVDFWFRGDSLHFEREFFEWIQSWLNNDWSLENICYPGRSISWADYYIEFDEVAIN